MVTGVSNQIKGESNDVEGETNRIRGLKNNVNGDANTISGSGNRVGTRRRSQAEIYARFPGFMDMMQGKDFRQDKAQPQYIERSDAGVQQVYERPEYYQQVFGSQASNQQIYGMAQDH